MTVFGDHAYLVVQARIMHVNFHRAWRNKSGYQTHYQNTLLSEKIIFPRIKI